MSASESRSAPSRDCRCDSRRATKPSSASKISAKIGSTNANQSSTDRSSARKLRQRKIDLVPQEALASVSASAAVYDRSIERRCRWLRMAGLSTTPPSASGSRTALLPSALGVLRLDELQGDEREQADRGEQPEHPGAE